MGNVPQIFASRTHFIILICISVFILLSILHYGQYYVVTTYKVLVIILNVDTILFLVFKAIVMLKPKNTIQNR
jgi:hypothetical protein